MSQHEVILLLGSNKGNQKINLEKAISLIEDEIGSIVLKTNFLITEPVEFVSSNNFVNFAVLLNTCLSPIHLLRVIKNIEKKMGRLLDSKAFGSYQDRIIDIDIVSYDQIKYQCGFLEIPHRKHQFEREFSKILLKEILTLKHKA